MINAPSLIINSLDGYPLAAHYFEGEGDAAIVFASATAVPQTLYFKLAQELSKQGFHVYTFDYSGIGASLSGSLKDNNRSMFHWGEQDLEAVLRYTFKQHSRIYLAGHSVGGQIFSFAPSSAQLSGAYFLASQSAYYKHWQGWNRFKVKLFWALLLPISSQILGYMPGFIMGSPESLSKAAAYSWKEFAHHAKGSLGLIPQALERANKFAYPIKMRALKNDDTLSPLSSVQALFQEFCSANAQLLYEDSNGWEGIGHFDFFRSKNNMLWPDLINFFLECEEKF